jgi:hypothetical protein
MHYKNSRAENFVEIWNVIKFCFLVDEISQEKSIEAKKKSLELLLLQTL